MSDLKEIKQRIYEEDLIMNIFEAMECQHIKPSGGRIEAQLPSRFNSNNKRSVQCKLNEHLTCSIRNRADFEGGDIYSLVSYIVNDKRGKDIEDDLFNAKTFICETLGWKQYLKGGSKDDRIDYVAPLKAIIKAKKRRAKIKSNPVLPESILDTYINYPCELWIDEGISYKTQKMYGIGFDLESKRITIPLRNRFGKLVGVKGRILRDEDDDRKYIYLYPCNNRYEWFNLHYAQTYITMEKKVYIFESEKSCMKAFEHGIYNTLAIGASEISVEQAQIIKQLGLDIEIILCYDKGISIDEIRTNARKFDNRKVLAVYDTDNILNNKNSPIDEGVGKWHQLLESCTYEIKEEVD